MARGFSPADSLTFKWTDPTGQPVNDFVQYPAFGRDGDYTKVSHLRVKESDSDANKRYKCEAENSEGKKETHPAPPPKRVIKPSITLLSRAEGDEILLECQLNDYYPDKLTVQWLRDEQLVSTSLSNKKLQSADKGEKNFTLISQLAISAQNQGRQYTCKATHISEEIIQVYNVCTAQYLSKPLVNVKKPLLRDIIKRQEITTTCVVEAPYNTKVSWLTNGISKKATMESKTNGPSSRTQIIVSNLTISREEWLKLQTIVCEAKHPCFQVEKHAIKVDDIQKGPVVVIRRPFTESAKADSAVLECVVRNLSSGEVCITFQANGADISEAKCVDAALSEKIQPLTIDFTIPSEHHKKDKTFTCTVHSPSKKWTSKPTGNIFDDPAVELLVVPSVGESSSGPQKLVCSGTGFDPKIRWLSKSQEKSGTAEDVTIREDGRLKVDREILVPQQEWNQGVTFTCEITDRHVKINKSTDICAVVNKRTSQMADVYLLGPSLSTVRSGTDVFLTCLVVAYHVTDFSIQWRVDGNSSNLHDCVQDPKNNVNGTQSKQSILQVPVSTWHAYSLFTCEVKHFCSGTQQLNISKTREPKQPTLRILQPSDRDLSGGQNTSLLCLITGFFSADISVQWQLNGTQLDASHFTNSPVSAHDAGGDYSMYSALTLPASPWMGTYSCVVSHESSTNPIIATLENLYSSVIHTAPSAELLQGSGELVCLAFGFSPSAINITWMLGMTELSHDRVTSPAKGPDGKFSIRSYLHLLPSEWAPGEVYTCRVNHITGTLSLNISKPEIFEEAIFMNEIKPEAIAQDSVQEVWNMACAFLVLFLCSLFYGGTVTLVRVNPA